MMELGMKGKVESSEILGMDVYNFVKCKCNILFLSLPIILCKCIFSLSDSAVKKPFQNPIPHLTGRNRASGSASTRYHLTFRFE